MLEIWSRDLGVETGGVRLGRSLGLCRPGPAKLEDFSRCSSLDGFVVMRQTMTVKLIYIARAYQTLPECEKVIEVCLVAQVSRM